MHILSGNVGTTASYRLLRGSRVSTLYPGRALLQFGETTKLIAPPSMLYKYVYNI